VIIDYAPNNIYLNNNSRMLTNKAVDKMTDHRIDMVMLAIIVPPPTFSSLASSAASFDPITTFSSSSFVTSYGKIARTRSL
jgi:hypothetical protein